VTATLERAAGGLLEGAAALFAEGGPVMWPLLATATLLWFGIGHRLLSLRSALVDLAAESARDALRRGGPRPRWRVEDAVAPLAERLRSYAVLVRTLVLVAPLLGLLGTVTGMVELFDSLAEGALYTQSGGIAAGISEAMLTTELGLAIAIPGFVLGRLLDAREARLAAGIERVLDETAAGVAP
jgi:biopolymer transport protein ExbB